MGENSKIEWTDHTFNPWRGCTKVAAGCAHCYADRQAKRNPGTLGIWGKDGTRVLASDAMWREPVKWNKAAACIHSFDCNAGAHSEACPQANRPRVFCASMADVFEDWPGQLAWSDGTPAIDRFSEEPFTLKHARRDLFALIDRTPNIDWLLLTKRPGNVRRMAYDSWTEKTLGHVSQNEGDGRRWKPRPNVWLGTSIATQEDADRNIPELLKCRGLSPVLFVSAEPLLEPVAIDELVVPYYDGQAVICPLSGDWVPETPPPVSGTIDWVICGGESGPNARPMHPSFARSLRDQCTAAGVPFFFKQWGEFTSPEQLDDDAFQAWDNHATSMQQETDVLRFGKKFCGRLLDGREWNEFPAKGGA